MHEDAKDIKITPGSASKKIKKNVDLKPTLHESRDQGRVDSLVHALMGENVDMAKGRHVIMDPKGSVSSAQYRECAAVALDRLLEVVFADPTLYQKVRQDLNQKHFNEGIVSDILKDTAKDMATQLLHKNLGVVGKAIAKRIVKRSKK